MMTIYLILPWHTLVIVGKECYSKQFLNEYKTLRQGKKYVVNFPSPLLLIILGIIPCACSRDIT